MIHPVLTNSPALTTQVEALTPTTPPLAPLDLSQGHNPYGISPGSMSPASPRGGGVEALRLSRSSFSALNINRTGTPSGSALGFGTSPGASGSGSGSGSGTGSGLIIGNGNGNTNGSASGSSTPYGNLNLAGALAGGGAPGSATPQEETKKNQAMYPSRVVLTSECSFLGSSASGLGGILETTENYSARELVVGKEG